MGGDDGLEIPARPSRRYPYGGTLEYEGGAVAELTPEVDLPQPDVTDLVETVLAEGPYYFGDFFDLPMPVWLVRDRETSDSFRVSVRDGAVRLHPIPTTDPAGLRAFRDRIQSFSETAWSVAWHGGTATE